MTNKNDNLINLVIARLESMPDDTELAIGNFGSFSKKVLIQNINDNSNLGKEVVKIQLQYLQDMVSGKLYENLL
jgi:uncharacterized membrane protein YvbJ